MQINIRKTIPKYVDKKRNTKSIVAIATLICKPIFLTLISENIVRLQQSEQFEKKKKLAIVKKLKIFEQ